jgi:hypothetical protein
MLGGTGLRVVELSALRAAELPALVAAIPALDLRGYLHVSIHAPSQFVPEEEPRVVRMLRELTERGFPVIVHPDVIRSVNLWRAFGATLWIENMDKRKPVGRSAAEMATIFELLPEAGFCFDLAHARQFDPSMAETKRILARHGARMREIHLSEVSTASRHTRLSFGAIQDFKEIAHRIPPELPIVIESPVPEDAILGEVARARDALPERARAVA